MANSIDFSEPWSWGTPVEWDERGRAIVYKFEFEDGSAIITHVFWADREADRDPRVIERK